MSEKTRIRLTRLAHISCVAVYSGMMAFCGFTTKSWQFWLGFACLIGANLSGFIEGLS